MDRHAIFVDAGYFYAAGAQVLQEQPGQRIFRKSISLKVPGAAIISLCQVASDMLGGMPLLRTYWYDAMPGPRLSLEQSSLAILPCVKLRLGVLNNVGEQKGVDSLVVTDLIELARNGAIADAVIVSGDEDLRIAVQLAQSFGVRVHILAAGDPKNNVSASLQMEADSVGSLPKEWFREHILVSPPKLTPKPAIPKPAGSRSATGSASTLDSVAKRISTELLAAADINQVTALKAHFATSNSVPPEFDRRLIGKTAAELDRKLAGEEMRHIRGIFVRVVRSMT